MTQIDPAFVYRLDVVPASPALAPSLFVARGRLLAETTTEHDVHQVL